MDRVKITVNGRCLEATADASLMEVCLDAGIFIPHLCYHPDLKPTGECGLCVVEISGLTDLQPACDIKITPGMQVETSNQRVKSAQRRAMEEILAIHPAECGSCVKYLNCELQSLKQYFGIDQLSIPRRPRLFPVNDGNPLFIIDPNKCVLCERCVRACRDLRGVGILSKKPKGEVYYIGTEKDLPLSESGCRFCGACAEVCPTGAILDKDEAARGSRRKRALVPCRYNCPAEIDVPGYLRLIRAGDYTGAEALIRERVPFPGLLGYVCDHPCESACRRGPINQPVAIRDLKRMAVEKSSYVPDLERKPNTGRKIAVIGAGPAGLTAAFYLAKTGHHVEIFEKDTRPGGMPALAIPRFRLPDAVLLKELAWLHQLGIVIHTQSEVNELESLLATGFEAVLVAVGTHRGSLLPIPGADALSVMIGLDFLKKVKNGEKIITGRSVLVLGGGSVAFDCARTSLRLGALKVRLACLEPRENLPAAPEDLQAGVKEGIEIFPSLSFQRILTQSGSVCGIECSRVESLTFDEYRNPLIEISPDSQHILEADQIIMAVGQRPDIPEGFALNTTPAHCLDVDAYTMATGREGVFGAGDAINGATSVIKAIASGRQAATAIDQYLGGDGNIKESLSAVPEPGAVLGRDDNFAHLTRSEAVCPPAGCQANFAPDSCTYQPDEGAAESHRCLQCDLRLKIRPVKFWSSY